MKTTGILAVLFSLTIIASCDSSSPTGETVSEQGNTGSVSGSAVVSSVSFSGGPGNYNFSVTVESPDTDCNQYADWWEVIDSEGTLLYRRILAHSHVGEQPFTRSGGPVNIAADQAVIVRAHMNNLGYGTQVFSGSVAQGLSESSIDRDFAAELESAAPLPDGCAF